MKIKDIETRYTNHKHQEMKNLHDAFGIDWTKPYTEIEHNDKFTIKSLLKELAEYGNTPKDSLILAIVRGCESWDNDEWRVVRIFDDEYNIDLPYCIDHFYRKGDFEYARKQVTCEAIFFAQKKEYITPSNFSHNTWGGYQRRDKAIDIYGRLKDTTHVGYYEPKFDKSGYLLNAYRKDLQKRFHVYKANKDCTEYLKTNNTDKITILERLIEDYKEKLSKDILSIDTIEDLKGIEDLQQWGRFYNILHTFADFKKKTLDRSYNSIKASDDDFDYVSKKCYAYLD